MLLDTSVTCVVIFNWGMTVWLTLVTRRKAFNRLVASIIGITMQENPRARRRPPLKKVRSQAFRAQGGVCYYCNQPMWMKSEQELTSRYPITAKQAKLLQCTGEHLVAYSEGGNSRHMNIAAACLYCNRNRHRGKKSFTPDRFQQLARRRLSKGAWHGMRLTR